MIKEASAAKTIAKFTLFILLLSLPIIFWLNRFDIYDWWRLRNYTPPPEIAALAEKTTMLPAAKKIFYANHPRLDDRSQLVDDCRQPEYTIVLGCYVAGKGIFLYNVPDPRLEGAKEVTAAHEMLHAAYDRLSADEKKSINKELEAAFKSVTNERIKATVEQYRQKDPAIVPNELHSIMGTEVRNLPVELEQYYKRYFDNRAVIVDCSEQYEGEFTSRQSRVKAYDQQIANITKEIDQNQAQLQSESVIIVQERERLNSLLASQNYETYNASVENFNARIAAYNSLASRTRQLIEQHNTFVAERNALAIEVNDLVKAIDSRPQAIPAQ